MAKKWVNASDLGKVVYCPKSLELQCNGVKPNRQSVDNMRRGNLLHEEFNRQVKASDSRCFIATAIYGINHPKTQLLRQFRDEKLARHIFGRLTIQVYYAVSPLYIKIITTYPSIKRITKRLLDAFVARINRCRGY
jgi:hypothetical protein